MASIHDLIPGVRDPGLSPMETLQLLMPIRVELPGELIEVFACLTLCRSRGISFAFALTGTREHEGELR